MNNNNVMTAVALLVWGTWLTLVLVAPPPPYVSAQQLLHSHYRTVRTNQRYLNIRVVDVTSYTLTDYKVGLKCVGTYAKGLPPPTGEFLGHLFIASFF